MTQYTRLEAALAIAQTQGWRVFQGRDLQGVANGPLEWLVCTPLRAMLLSETLTPQRSAECLLEMLSRFPAPVVQ